jgi:hypothetical protein
VRRAIATPLASLSDEIGKSLAGEIRGAFSGLADICGRAVPVSEVPENSLMSGTAQSFLRDAGKLSYMIFMQFLTEVKRKPDSEAGRRFC